MAQKESSRKKPGKKANLHSQSTSFLTTELPDQATNLKPLGENEKSLILETMYRGGSPGWVCKDLGVDYSRYLKTLDEDENFSRSVEDAKASLSENIAFQLFRTAMEGNVTAQTNFLKIFPPVNWYSSGQTSEMASGSDEWIEKMTDKELFQLAKEMDIHVPEAG